MSGIVDDQDTSFDTTNGKTITMTIYDSLGYKYTAKFSLHQVTATGGGVTYDLYSDGVYDADDTAVQAANTSAILTGIAFDESTGKISAPNTGDAANFGFEITGLKGEDMEITIDYSGLLNYSNNGQSTVAMDRGTSASDTTGAGYSVGSMIGVSVGTDGTLTGTYDNGQTKLLGKIPTATFSNASGLSKEGENLYSESLNSGAATVNDITASGSGKMTSGQLEMSNVDLAREFTTMITTQRGFQANSRIITVSDTLLEELTNLKR